MLPGPEGFHIQLVVGWNGGGIHKDIEIAVSQHLVNIGRPPGNLKTLGILLSPLWNDIANRYQLHIRET